MILRWSSCSWWYGHKTDTRHTVAYFYDTLSNEYQPTKTTNVARSAKLTEPTNRLGKLEKALASKYRLKRTS